MIRRVFDDVDEDIILEIKNIRFADEKTGILATTQVGLHKIMSSLDSVTELCMTLYRVNINGIDNKKSRIDK